MALDCDHPRANIALPPSSPARLTWQPPALIPGLPPEAQRVIRESLQGIYDELTRLAATGTIVPLLDDLIYALPGQTIQGVANGQEIILPLPRPGAASISIVVDDVAHPATVVHPDGTVTTIDKPGVVELYPGVENWIPPLGLTGVPGIQGPPGADGQDGVSIAGPQGDRGRDGAPGIQGPPGRDGEDGLTVVGPEGRPGRDAVPGIQGPPGNDGEDGASIVGPQGATGRDGAPGVQGPPGNDGEDGLSVVGPPGPTARDGVPGIQGPPGNDGEDGVSIVGAQGERGRDGAPGIQGPPGADGEDGVSIVGPQGAAGRDGAAGIQGPPGADGRDGVDGTDAVINPNSVTNAELANVPSPSLKGRTTPGTGDPEDLILVNSNTIEWNTSTGGSISTDFRDSVGMSVVGRAPNTTGDVADITVPVTTGGRFLRTNTAGWPSTNPTAPSLIGWGVITNPDLQPIPHNRFLANVTGADAPPAQVDFYYVADGSRGLEFDPADTVFFVKTGTGSTLFIHTDGTVQREAITGDVTIPQFSNAATIQTNVVDNTKLADMAAGTVKGRQIDAGSGDPVDLTGAEQGENIRFATVVTDTTSSGVQATYVLDAITTMVRCNTSGDVEVRGINIPTSQGQRITFHREPNSAGVWVFRHNTGGGITQQQLFLSNEQDQTLGEGQSIVLEYTNNRWRHIGGTTTALTDGDKGDITVSTLGTVWTIDNDVVSNAKAANMAESTIKGRALGAGTGDPTDLTGAQVGEIVRFGTTVTEASGGSFAPYTLAATTNTIVVTATSTFHGITGGSEGREVLIINGAAFGSGITVSFVQFSSSTTGGSGEKILLATVYGTDSVAVTLPSGSSLRLRYTSSRWRSGSPIDLSATVTDGTIWGRALGAGNGIPTNLTGLQVGDIARLRSGSTGFINGTFNDYAVTDGVRVLDCSATGGDVIFTGFAYGSSNVGAWFWLTKFGGSNRIIIKHQDAGSLAANRVNTPGSVDYILTQAGNGVLVAWDNTRLQVIDQSGLQIGEMLRIDSRQDETATSGSGTPYLVPAHVNWVRFTALTGTYTLDGSDVAPGKLTIWNVEPGVTGSLVFVHNSGALGTGNRFFCPGAVNLTLRSGESAITVYTSNRHRVVSVARTGFALTDGDKGDITVSSSGAAFTIDNSAVTLPKLANILDNRFLGNISGSTGAVTAVDFGSLNSTSIIYESTGKTFIREALTGDVTALQNNNATTVSVNAVGNTKLADMAQSTIKGRAEGAGTGDPTDLTPTQVVAIIDGESPTWTASHRFDSYVQFGTATALPSTGDIRKAGALTINSADDINLIATDNCTVDISNTLTLDGGAEVALVSANRISLNATSGLQFGPTTGMPIGGDIRKGSASVLDIRSSNGIQLCSLGGVVVYGATPSNAGTLIIGDGGGGDARLIAVPITGATNPELQMTNHAGTEALNNVTRGVNTTFSTTITAAQTQVTLVPAVTIPAGSWRVGRTYTAIGHVIVSRGSTATACALRSIHGLSGGYTETLDLALPTTINSSYTYRLEYTLTCLSVGSSGSFMHSMRMIGGLNDAAPSMLGTVNTSPHTVDTTTSQTITAEVNMTVVVTDLAMTRTTGYIMRTF